MHQDNKIDTKHDYGTIRNVTQHILNIVIQSLDDKLILARILPIKGDIKSCSRVVTLVMAVPFTEQMPNQ